VEAAAAKRKDKNSLMAQLSEPSTKVKKKVHREKTIFKRAPEG